MLAVFPPNRGRSGREASSEFSHGCEAAAMREVLEHDPLELIDGTGRQMYDMHEGPALGFPIGNPEMQVHLVRSYCIKN